MCGLCARVYAFVRVRVYIVHITYFPLRAALEILIRQGKANRLSRPGKSITISTYNVFCILPPPPRQSTREKRAPETPGGAGRLCSEGRAPLIAAGVLTPGQRYAVEAILSHFLCVIQTFSRFMYS